MTKLRLLPKASELYAKIEDGSYSFSDHREDLSMNIKNSSDILIEEGDIHLPVPYALEVSDILQWSRDNEHNFKIIIDEIREYYSDESKKLRKYTAEYLPFYASDKTLDDIDVDISNMSDGDKTIAILDFCRRRIREIRDTFTNDPDQLLELDTRRENIFRILLANTNYNLLDAKTKLYTQKFALTNYVTVLGSVWENGTEDFPYTEKFRQYTIGEVIEKLSDSRINDTQKEARNIVFSNTSGNRPVGEVYHEWSGLQIFDVDLKKSTRFAEIEKEGITASVIRDELFHKLKQYPWLVSIQLSASKRSLHIYTKVSRMHHLFDSDEANNEISKFWFRMSYYQKWTIFAFLLEKLYEIDVVKESKVLDAHAAKIQQGIALNYDADAKYNTGFYDLYPTLFFHKPPMPGIADSEWITRESYLQTFNSWWYNNKVLYGEAVGKPIASTRNLEYSVDDDALLADVGQIDMRSLGSGNRYSTRWRVCNTMIDIFGDSTECRNMIHHILQTKETRTESQINSFINSAILHKKTADAYTVKTLVKLGVKIKITEESKEELRESEIERIKYAVEHSNYLFDDVQPNSIVRLKQQRIFLSHKKNQILDALKSDKINIIESPPGTGKTEFFKQLSRKYSVCLVLPFTSTIVAKVESDEQISQYYEVYYGSRSVKDLREHRKASGKKSAVMTFDKFSRINTADYSMFDFIAIDESHLLFTSAYRLSVVGRVTENLRKYTSEELTYQEKLDFSDVTLDSLLNSSAIISEPANTNAPKLILMSGTVTGEMTYFDYYNMMNYIKVIKKHQHKKKAEFIFAMDDDTKRITVYELIAEAIRAGKKVIHPTNRGDAHASDIANCVEAILDRPVLWEYYKKANADEEFVQKINEEETIDEVELLFCTDYLSVGIDINDTSNFVIIYDSGFTAEDVEQFNNRIRKTDIDSKIVYTVLDEDGMMRGDLFRTDKIDLTRTSEIEAVLYDDRLLSEVQHEIQTSTKYYSILGRMLSKYYTVNDNGRVEYVRAAFELDQFEKQYKNIAAGLLYVKSSLEKKYGYDLSFSYVESKTEQQIERFREIAANAKLRHKTIKSNSYKEIIEFCTIPGNLDIIRQGNFKIKKDIDKFLDKIGASLYLAFDSKTNEYTLYYARHHKFAIEGAIRRAVSMSRYYSKETIAKIIENCTSESTGLINYTELERYTELVRFISMDNKNLLSDIVKETLKTLYDFIDPSEDKAKIDRFEFEDMILNIQNRFHKYIQEASKSNVPLKSESYIKRLNRSIEDGFVKTFVDYRRGKENVNVRFRKVYAFDSDYMRQTATYDEIFDDLLLDKTDGYRSNIAIAEMRTVSDVHDDSLSGQSFI